MPLLNHRQRQSIYAIHCFYNRNKLWRSMSSLSMTDIRNLASQVKRCPSLRHGRTTHAHIVESGQHKDLFLSNTLVDMYGRRGSVEDAFATFSAVDSPNVFSWNIMMTAYNINGHAIDAISLFRRMSVETCLPDRVTFLSILSACAEFKNLHQGKIVEVTIYYCSSIDDVVVNSAVVNMYNKCDSLDDAQRVFDLATFHDVVSWNTMIVAYSNHKQGSEAFAIYSKMIEHGVSPSEVTYSALFNMCAINVLYEQGRKLHADLKKRGVVVDVVMGNALINMYGKCRSLKEARDVFDSMETDNNVTWGSIIAACVNQDQSELGIQLFRQMHMESLIPDAGAITHVLCASASLLNVFLGKQMHSSLDHSAIMSDLVVHTALLNVYGKCKCLEHAQSTFDLIVEKDVISHNSMIDAYCQTGGKRKAVQQFQQLVVEGLLPSNVTFTVVFNACTEMTLFEGKFMHAYIQNSNIDLNVEMGCALVTMYGKHGKVQSAKLVFEELVEQDIVVWNAMIAVYARHECYHEACQLFYQLQLKGIAPNDVTFVSTLSGCIAKAHLGDGKRMHACIIGYLLESDIGVGTALISMYAKCGDLENARTVFDVLPSRNVVTWNAIITAYAHHGYSKEAMQIFNQMESKGLHPDEATFSSILSACSRSGNMDDGICCFQSIVQTHNITPTVQHINCVIDLLGRAGRLQDGETLMSCLPSLPGNASLMTLLSACRLHLDIARGERVVKTMSKRGVGGHSASLLLSNIFESDKRQNI